jgi:hypothetical protein
LSITEQLESVGIVPGVAVAVGAIVWPVLLGFSAFNRADIWSAPYVKNLEVLYASLEPTA